MPRTSRDVKVRSRTDGLDGRSARSARTRKAIVDAAIAMLRAGRRPAIDTVAKAAGVSRRTVYVHFPTLQQLVLDATAGSLASAHVDAVFAPDASTEARVEALARTLAATSAQTLPLGRALIRLTVEPAQRVPRTVRRGYRRVAWIERALEPLRARVDAPAFERLVSALAVVLGWEAMIVLEDLRGLAPPDEERVLVWAARALVRAAVAEADASGGANPDAFTKKVSEIQKI